MKATAARKTALQFLRYGVVGALSNGLMFLVYLAVTALGLGPKLAATLVYGLGVLQTFHLNRSWSFGAPRRQDQAFLKYAVAYGLGYLVNIGLLAWFVDRLGFPHQLVQGTIIVSLAVAFFVLQKFWIFPGARDEQLPARIRVS